MSLLCAETQQYIMFGTPLFCGSLKEGGFMCALSEGVVAHIPVGERRADPCATTEDGLNIYEASSADEPTSRGAYQSGFSKGRFLFSVSPETARRYLPRTWVECPPDAPPTPIRVNIIILEVSGEKETIH
jgi:hypothetical protein